MKKSELFEFIQPYDEDTKDNLKKRVQSHLGHCGIFDDDVWVYKNHADYTISNENKFKIYFLSIPKQYKDITKYFILRKIQAVGTMKISISNLSKFFNFIIDKFRINDLNEMHYHVLEDYKREIEDMKISTGNIKGYWYTLTTFFNMMSDFKEIPKVVLPGPPDYVMIEKRNIKLNGLDENSVPPNKVYIDLDKVFIEYSNGIPIHIQLIYWTLRLIPSRINEVLDMKIDKALRKVNNEFKITIPVPKTSNHIKIKEKIISLTGKSKAEKFLIELIENQKKVAISLQNEVKEKKLTEGLLYTIKRIDSNTTKLFQEINYSNRLVGRFRSKDFNYWLKKIIKMADSIEDKLGYKIYNFRNERNKLYEITSHDFRHEAITDRLDYGFLTHNVMFLAGLVTEDTVFGYYTSRKETVVLSEPIYKPNDDFKNSDEKLIKPSDIGIGEFESKLVSSVSFQGNGGVDDILLDFQIEIEQHTPIITNDGYYLGNCPNYYNCSKIKKQLNCIGCKHSNEEIIEGGMEFIEKALKSYERDMIFHKENGNIRMANLAKEFYDNFYERKKQILLGGKNDGEKQT